MTTDAELIRQYAVHRSENAFAELVHRHLDGVYSAALRRVGGDAHLAQDVAQAVFIALARQSRSLADHPFLTAWLYATTRNEAATTVRRERRRKTREAAASAMNETDTAPSAESADDWTNLSPVLDDAIDQLSEKDRAAILLRYIDRRPFAQIGAHLRITEDAARMRVDRALDKLRTLLTKRGLTSTSTALSLILSNNAVAAVPASFAATLTSASLTALPASAGLGAAIITSMSTAKTTLTVAALACVLAGSVAWHQITSSRSSQTALADAEKSHAALLVRHQALKLEVETFERAVRLQAATAVTSPAAPPTNNPPEDPRANGRAFLARHPEVKQALLERARASVRFTWAPFFESSGITSEQIEQFTQIMAESGWFGPGTSPGEKPMLFSLGISLDPNEGEKRLHEILGDDLYRKRLEFGRSITARDFARRVASTLAFSDEPLTADQAAKLTPLISASKATKSSDRATAFDWDAIMAKSHGMLSAIQLGALEGMRAEDEYQRASTEAAKEARQSISKKASDVSR